MRRRETRLIIVAYDQLYLVRPLAAAAIRLPWQRSQPPGKMTPARVGPGFASPRNPRQSRQSGETRQAQGQAARRIQEQAQGIPAPRRQTKSQTPGHPA